MQVKQVADCDGSPAAFAKAAQYELFEHECLGATATWKTFRGYDFRRKVYVAIKRAAQDQPEGTERWHGLSASFGHSCHRLATIHDIDESHRWIIMELLSDQLAQSAKRSGIPAVDIKQILREACEGLAYLHGEGLLHLGIKPSNLMLLEDGHVKLTDARNYRLGERIPVPSADDWFVAPEILQPTTFGNPSFGSDLFSLGLTVLRLGLGKKFYKHVGGGTFKARSGNADWFRWLASPNDHVRPASELLPTLESSVAEVLDRLVAKDPNARYSNAKEVLHDLEEMSSEQEDPVRKRPNRTCESPSRRVAKPSGTVTVVAAPTGTKVGAAGYASTKPADAFASIVSNKIHDWIDRAREPKSLLLIFGGVVAAATMLVMMRQQPEVVPVGLKFVATPDAKIVVHRVADNLLVGEVTAGSQNDNFTSKNAALRLPSSGLYRIAAFKDKHDNYEKTIDVRGDDVFTIRLVQPQPLVREKLMNDLRVSVSPATASIVLTDLRTDDELSCDRDESAENVRHFDFTIDQEGSFQAVVTANQHHSETVNFSGSVGDLSFVLKKESIVVVSVDPPDAEVYVNRKRLDQPKQPGVFEYRLPPGVTNGVVHVKKEGYSSSVVDFRLEQQSGYHLVDAIVLERDRIARPEKMEYWVYSQPEGATVYLEGDVVGTTPVRLEVEPGQYTLQVQAGAYLPWKRNVYIGEAGNLTAVLSRREQVDSPPAYVHPDTPTLTRRHPR